MSFIIGLLFGAAAGVWVGRRYPRPEFPAGEVLSALPTHLPDMAQAVEAGLRRRLQTAQEVFRATRVQTRERLQRELEAARSR